MTIYDLQAKSADNKIYYWSVLDCKSCETFMIKNASCEASIWSFLSDKYNIERMRTMVRFSIFFNHESELPNKKYIPKMYQKYFQLNNN